MDPIRSAIGGGIVGTTAFTVLLAVADLLARSYEIAVFEVVAALVDVGGGLTYAVYAFAYVVVWPLLFAALTQYLPGETGWLHGLLFGLALWVGYVATALYGVALAVPEPGVGPLVGITLVAYLAYGVVLGGVYDVLAAHRTFAV